MNLRRFEKARVVVTSLLGGVLVGAFSYALSGLVSSPSSPKFTLISGTGFTITSTIYNTYPGCTTTTTTKLYPGETRCIRYTVHNSLAVPITVTSITVTKVTVLPTSTTKCKTSDITPTGFSGTLPVAKSGSATTAGEPLFFKTDGTQDPCEGRTVDFTLHGTATYSSVCTGGAARCLVFVTEPARTQTTHIIGSVVDSTPQGTPRSWSRWNRGQAGSQPRSPAQ